MQQQQQSISLPDEDYLIESDDVHYTPSSILAHFTHVSTQVKQKKVTKTSQQMVFKTDRIVPRIGVMLVGWGGNNGSTFTAGILANREKLTWHTKEGMRTSNYFGSLTQSSTVRLGEDEYGRTVYIPFKNMLPMVHPNDIEIGGWDINSANLAEAMARSQVDLILSVDVHRPSSGLGL
jgi:myo-inositol-1-phosphate synthase